MRPPRALDIAGVMAVAIATLLFAVPTAQADFGFLAGAEGFRATATNEGGAPATLAGSHPYALTTKIAFNLAEGPFPPGGPFTEGDVRDVHLDQPPGLIENPGAVQRCTLAEFNTPRSSPFEEPSLSGENCPAQSQIGVVTIHTSYGGGTTRTFGVFNLSPPPGAPSQIGFSPYGDPITFVPNIRQANGEYALTLSSRNISQALDLYSMEMTIWGTPWNSGHNGERGNCLDEAESGFPWAKCPVKGEHPPEAYLTLPTSCATPLSFTASADSWQDPGTFLADGEPNLGEAAWKSSSSNSAENLGECKSLSFTPQVITQPTSERATTATGLHFHLENNEEGLLDPKGRASSQIKKTVVALPEGMTLNPSVGAGLGVCTPGQYAAETVSSPLSVGCPNNSKIGEISVESPLLEGPIKGSLYLAQPFENPFGTILALYIVARTPERGIIVKVAGKVEPNLTTGRLIATFDDLPQLPYTHLNVDFRAGQRAPLITPSSCGTYTSKIELHPWLEPETILPESYPFHLNAGIEGVACPGAGPSPFTPGANAGDLNSNAGSYTPFYLHLTRTDAEQEITSYSAKLPPGLLGKIAGIPYCPEADIEAAKAESGTEEEVLPSCPPASEIGHTVSGFGVGGVLAYAPGRLFLSGPYHGSALSIVAIDSATVGPFDLGVIVVRSAIEVNPQTAQISIDSAASDPIPHIRDGIPLHLRDIRVYISRPNFTVNPTSCEPFSVVSTLTGSSAPFANPKDITGTASVPFHVSNCSSLKFAPKLSLKLKGGTKRGSFPSLRATVTEESGDANIGTATVTLPRAEFLEQGHISEICTIPRFEAETCPAGSVYGHAAASTPLLSEPLEGPVYLKASNSALPDLVAALRGDGGIAIDVEGRIDTGPGGGMRATFDVLPDAPASKFVLTLDGGSKSLLVNSLNVCAAPPFAIAHFTGQDNQAEALRPRLQAQCSKHKKGRSHRRRGGRR